MTEDEFRRHAARERLAARRYLREVVDETRRDLGLRRVEVHGPRLTPLEVQIAREEFVAGVGRIVTAYRDAFRVMARQTIPAFRALARALPPGAFDPTP